MRILKAIESIKDLQYAKIYDFILIEDSFNEALLMDSVISKSDMKPICGWINNAELVIEAIEKDLFPRTKLVLLDIRMPGVDGLECLTTMKNEVNKYVNPIVMLSSSDHSSDISKAYEHNCNGYIVKNSDIIEFRQKIKTTLEFWINVNSTI
jgi:DNA-binding NarL/FixJ family response regulator